MGLSATDAAQGRRCRLVVSVRKDGAELATRILEPGSPLLGSRQRAQIDYDLPPLRLGQARPGWHTVTQIALAEEPLQIAIRGHVDAWGGESRLLSAISLGLGSVTLQAVISIEQGPCLDRVGFSLEWVGPRMVPGRLQRPREMLLHQMRFRGRQRRMLRQLPASPNSCFSSSKEFIVGVFEFVGDAEPVELIHADAVDAKAG
jgi:hypothetical protein